MAVIVASLSHRVRPLGAYFKHYSHFTGLPIGIFVCTQILLCHLVYVRVGAVLDNFRYTAANFQITIWVVRIDDGKRNPWIASHVLVFLPSACGIYYYQVAF